MIGVLGGTFDPIHFGHLRSALDVLQALELREVRFTPLNVAVHRTQPRASGTQRLAMVRAAVEDQTEFVIDERELRRSGGSYSYDTLLSLRSELGPDLP
ncbi:MAG: adenylyltransferase/cytidyltransferase family protein, partial [Pseudomonadota bacterium]|nr:adenylyltransferase/cytidyltransferase family protein [Pseudomonadota bacterium]